MPFLLFLLFACTVLHAAPIPEKVLICGVCKNVEKSLSNFILSSTRLGKQFLDYRVIVFENNSTDSTKDLLKAWASFDPYLIAVTADFSEKDINSICTMGFRNRTEILAYARNRVLDIAMSDTFSDFKYVIWADMDFLESWDLLHILDTILHPQEEWDAVLANGAYDLFALRDPEFPIGFELLGNLYWNVIDQIRSRFHLDPSGKWRRVYSAFGGLGIYKREALKDCHYSGIVTAEMEDYVLSWLQEPSFSENTCLAKYYQHLLSSLPIHTLKDPLVRERHHLPAEMGLIMQNHLGRGRLAWFSCPAWATLPYTCEHIPLFASMAAKGHNRFFINPKIRSNHPQ